MVKLRLKRMGTKKKPFYRLVVADSTAPRDGAFIETIGHYDPRANPPSLVVDGEKALNWLRRGAHPTDTVARLLSKLEITLKKAEPSQPE